jgi:hypothetical protein
MAEALVPVFASADDVGLWLNGQPRDIAALLAVRATLRAVPGFLFIPDLDREMQSRNAGRNMLLQAFRSAAAGWVAVAYPRARLRAPVTGSVRNDAQRAAENAFAAIFAENDETATKHANVAVATALSAASAISVQALDAELSALVEDVSLLEDRVSSEALAFSSLWPDRPPEHVSAVWGRLKDSLLSLDEGWDVWLEWYEDRLDGSGAGRAFVTALAEMPEGVWPGTPATINKAITGLLYSASDTKKSSRHQELDQNLADIDLEGLAIVGTRAALRTLPLLSEMGFASPAMLEFFRVF